MRPFCSPPPAGSASFGSASLRSSCREDYLPNTITSFYLHKNLNTTFLGTIQNIPLVPYRDSSFIIKVNLQNGLSTNYQKTIHFTNNLTGVAEIITNDATLAERLLYQWRGLFKR